MRFLGPYRRIVLISVTCAFFVGLIMTGGLGAMLPILRVLIDGDTVSGWVDRQVAERRAGITLSPDNRVIRVTDEHRRLLGENALTPGVTLSQTRVDELASGASDPLSLRDAPWYLRRGQAVARRVPADPVWAIVTVFGFVAILAVVGNAVRFFQEYFSDKAAISAVADIRRRLYDHVLHVPLNYFGHRGTTDVTSRLMQDCQGLQDGFKTLLGQSIQEPIKAGFAFGLAMLIDWRLTLFIVLFAPLMFVLLRKFGKKMRRASRAALERNSVMLGQIEGTLIGIRVVKSAVAERFERRKFNGVVDDLRAEQLKMARYEAFSTPTLEMCAMLVIGIVLIVASYLMFRARTLDSASFFLILACLVAIGESMRRVSKLNAVLQKSNAAASRVFESMDLPTERKLLEHDTRHTGDELQVEDRARTRLPAFSREIRFDNVSFAYPGSTQSAIQGVSLTVARGASVAIVGRNGSGKTTLLAMLPRFYDPQTGNVFVDGHNLRDVTLRSLRRQISVVTQDSVIFPGTIAQNIAYGHALAMQLHPDTPAIRLLRQRIENAARRAFAHDFTLAKPRGYDAVLDGLGGQLSGGQKQRLNIARAIFREAPILILDEATSQVDAESEHLIQQAIQALMKECTTFVIAHRFSTIMGADRIVVLEQGRLVAQGRHDDLLRSSDVYAQLYERQLIGLRRE
jgi:ABC-type multidrug transport system fused ATPase/permease subunit